MFLQHVLNGLELYTINIFYKRLINYSKCLSEISMAK